ncbi:unnamed protein product [Closterium sp. Yama58-4]|nr:unnamed protein product [Closterium sp. Yama58-4]
MACIGAESACMDVDALFASCWEQNDSLSRFVCSMIAAPRLAVSSWIRPCEQAAVEVQSVPALPVVTLLEEAAASTDAELEAVTVDASTVTAVVLTEVEEAEEAEEAEKAEGPKELKKKATSFLELLAQEDLIPSRTSSVDSVAEITASSAKVAAWLGVKTGSEAQQGGKVEAEASSGWCSLIRSESSCSSRSACLIHLSSDTSSSSADSLRNSPTCLSAGVKRGIGRGVSGIGKECSLSAAKHFGLKPTSFTELLAAEKNSVKSGISKGVFCSGKDGSMEVKGCGKAEEGRIVSNQLYGCDGGEEEEEEEEDGSSKQGFRTLTTGTMCYMNQLYMDEEEEEEREELAASGISLGIGRFGARRRITGSSSRVTLRRMSSVLRQY